MTGGGDLADAVPRVDGSTRGFGEHTERGPELAEEVLRALRVVRRKGFAEPHLFEEQMRRVATRQVRELVDLDRLDAALQRQQRERQRVGDEARAAPGRVHRRPATRARVEHARTRVVVEPSTGVEELAARRDDVRPGLEQRDHIGEVERARHVQHAVGVERVDRGRDRSSRGRRSVVRRRASPRRHRLSPGRRRARPRGRGRGAGSLPATRDHRCCRWPTGPRAAARACSPQGGTSDRRWSPFENDITIERNAVSRYAHVAFPRLVADR